MEEQYSALKLELKKSGYDYKQVKCEPNIAYIYHQTFEGKHIAYEVFKHKINSLYNCVSFPSNEVFGLWAWTYKTLEQAEKKFTEIVEKKISTEEEDLIE